MARDSLDNSILEILQREGRITNAELSQRVGLTPGPVLARVAKLEACGIIERYAAILNRDAIGLPVTAFVAVIMKSHGRGVAEAFLKAIKAMPQVIECHHIAGDEDYLLKVVAESPADYERFVLETLMELEDVQRINTTIVLSTPKYETAVPVGEPS